MKILQGTWNCLLKQYLKSWFIFWSTPHMTILQKSKKSRMCAIFSSEYFIYSLDWNIVFRLPLGYCHNLPKNSKMYALSSPRFFIYYALGWEGCFWLSRGHYINHENIQWICIVLMWVLNWGLPCKTMIVCNDCFAQMHVSIVQDFKMCNYLKKPKIAYNFSKQL